MRIKEAKKSTISDRVIRLQERKNIKPCNIVLMKLSAEQISKLNYKVSKKDLDEITNNNKNTSEENSQSENHLAININENHNNSVTESFDSEDECQIIFATNDINPEDNNKKKLFKKINYLQSPTKRPTIESFGQPCTSLSLEKKDLSPKKKLQKSSNPQCTSLKARFLSPEKKLKEIIERQNSEFSDYDLIKKQNNTPQKYNVHMFIKKGHRSGNQNAPQHLRESNENVSHRFQNHSAPKSIPQETNKYTHFIEKLKNQHNQDPNRTNIINTSNLIVDKQHQQNGYSHKNSDKKKPKRHKYLDENGLNSNFDNIEFIDLT